MRTCMPRIPYGLLFLVVALLAACGGGGGDGDSFDPGPYDLTFSLDASFQASHGGDPIHIALVRSSDGTVVDEDSGTVSGTQNPSFSFTSVDVMERGIDYEVHYWIDSNIGGGTIGVCDPTAIDHQWSTEFLSVTNNINFTVSYEPTLTEDVCGTFN